MRIEGVSIITCTNKSQFIDNIFANYQSQLWRKKELIIILNNDSLDIETWKSKASSYPNVSVFQLQEHYSLGRCLNFGVHQCKYHTIAKFDDDDYYSPYYIRSSMMAFRRTKADIVGRRSYFTYFEDDKSLYVRYPNRENSYQKYVAGGTIMFKRRVFRKVKFSDRSIGEDFTFLDACRRKGFRIYATNRSHYVYIRRANPNHHTWRPTKRYLRGTGRFVAYTNDFRPFAVRARRV
ncbi:glycosyltransferase [Brevibacillus sp. SYSU BS000544]|uniref:glycosyltransferase n=1 Tax=Brevibacillus sp. SYSU BS000544 TaxID=3416443 RepID=UPI003CE4F97C